MSSGEDTSSDEAVSQFMAFTGSSDATQAQSYLEMSGNDLQTAVSLFLEHQGGGGGGGMGSGIGGAASTGGMGGGAGMSTDPDGVRAPDQTRTMRLMDFDDDGPSAMARMGGNLMDHPLLGPHAAAMMQQMQMGGMGGMNMSAYGGMSSSGRSRGAFDHDVDDDDMDVDSQEAMGSTSFRDMVNRAAAEPAGADIAGTGTGSGTGENSGDDEVQVVGDSSASRAAVASRQARRLQEMFAPPTHLIHQGGGFQGARNVAKDTRRWLLVNLQSDEEFACHALNRDVWRDELCENLVREGFIFWQSVSATFTDVLNLEHVRWQILTDLG